MSKIVTLKHQTLPREASLFYACVEGKVAGGNYRLRLDNGEVLTAAPAVGCFLTPEPGDEVLLADDGRRSVILMVLSRVKDRGRISLPETCEVAGGEITFTGRKDIRLEAPQIGLTGLLGEVRFNVLSFLSHWCEFRSKKIITVGEVWDRVIGRLTERIRDSYRRIENTEQTTAGRIRTAVRGRFALSSQNVTLTAAEEVKVDGKKIHLG